MSARRRTRRASEPAPGERPRDAQESAFTALLRTLLVRSEAVLAAVFVDDEGEAIDWVARIDPHDAKIAGAEGVILLERLSAHMRPATGVPHAFTLSGSRRDVHLRRVDDRHSLVVVAAAREPETTIPLELAMRLVARRLRTEAALPTPTWEAPDEAIRVETRPARGFGYAPTAYVVSSGRVTIADVLGRWTEPLHGGLDCYRVRTTTQQELTLVCHKASGRWTRRP